MRSACTTTACAAEKRRAVTHALCVQRRRAEGSDAYIGLYICMCVVCAEDQKE
jgi:hypothetical protein